MTETMPRKSKLKMKPVRYGEDESLGERLTRIRKARGFTQQQLADQVGIIHVLVSDYERDKLRLSAEMAVRFAARTQRRRTPRHQAAGHREEGKPQDSSPAQADRRPPAGISKRFCSRRSAPFSVGLRSDLVQGELNRTPRRLGRFSTQSLMQRLEYSKAVAAWRVL
ncbi:MAG: helix-turn-helix transcriptional regulator [Acidobacteriota bacterium]